MYKLYARPGAGNVALRRMLAELRREYEVITLDRDAQRQLPESFRAINPMKQVPALVLPDGAGDDRECRHPDPSRRSSPQKPGWRRASIAAARPDYLRWMVFLATTLYMSDLRLYYPQRITPPKPAPEGIKAKAAADMMTRVRHPVGWARAKPYLTGDQIQRRRHLRGHAVQLGARYGGSRRPASQPQGAA